jgi:hypothetical protein
MNDLVARLLFVLICLMASATYLIEAGILGIPVFGVAILLWSPRIGKSRWWAIPGMLPLIGFAVWFLMALTPTLKEKAAIARDKR